MLFLSTRGSDSTNPICYKVLERQQHGADWTVYNDENDDDLAVLRLS